MWRGGGGGGGGRGRAGEWGATKWISQGSQRAHEDAVRMPLQHDIKRTGREGPRAPVKPSQARPGQARPEHRAADLALPIHQHTLTFRDRSGLL